MGTGETLTYFEHESELVSLLGQRETARIGLSRAIEAKRQADGDLAEWINNVSDGTLFDIQGIAETYFSAQTNTQVPADRSKWLEFVNVRLNVIADRDRPHDRLLVEVYDRPDSESFWSIALENVRVLKVSDSLGEKVAEKQ